MNALEEKDILPNTCAVVYFGELIHQREGFRFEIRGIFQTSNVGDAYHVYAETPNPASQIATGSDPEEFRKQLDILHRNLVDQKFLQELSECL